MKRLLPVAACLLLTTAAFAQTTLPIVDMDSGDSAALRLQCRHLTQAAQKTKVLDRQAVQELAKLVDNETADRIETGRAVQKLLDPYCLIGVTINPESRVKVGRGPCPARLAERRDRFFLVKVHNDAGVTAALRIGGPQVATANRIRNGHWLEAELIGTPPLSRRLLGQRLEYVVLRLRPHEIGKREVTLKVDVGQGSQDLGFRAEVPILFKVDENPKN